MTGLANAIEALGFPYGSDGFLQYENDILQRLCWDSYRASIGLAKEKGSFPLFNRDKYLQSEFVKTLPDDIQQGIHDHGIRNSHLTSIAPTGTISLCADNISSGIEPVFDYEIERTVQEFDGPRQEIIPDYGVRVLGVEGRRAHEVSVQEHLAVLSTAYKHVDSAVSKTCNVPGETSWEDFKQVYIDAWESGCKGCTTFRIDGKRGGIMKAVKEPEKLATGTDGLTCYVDPKTGRSECE